MKNLFASIPKDLEQEFFETVVQGEGIKVERIVSKGHRSPASGWYDQAQSEWVVVLKGEAIIAFEKDQEVVLKRGDHIDIAAHKRHRVKWTDPDEETVWLAVHYSQRQA